MASEIIYTKHAKEKFDVLKRHKFPVTKSQVEETVKKPDFVISNLPDKWIVQREVNKKHVLRVVYKDENGSKKVITFYPARKERYEL